MVQYQTCKFVWLLPSELLNLSSYDVATTVPFSYRTMVQLLFRSIFRVGLFFLREKKQDASTHVNMHDRNLVREKRGDRKQLGWVNRIYPNKCNMHLIIYFFRKTQNVEYCKTALFIINLHQTIDHYYYLT
jgi:hypothetical protein